MGPAPAFKGLHWVYGLYKVYRVQVGSLGRFLGGFRATFDRFCSFAFALYILYLSGLEGLRLRV